MTKTKPKPAKAIKSPDCPGIPAACRMGGNWATVFFLSLHEAESVAAWIREGTNWKFSCGGRHDPIGNPIVAPSGRQVWAVHFHLDNSRHPALVSANFSDL